MSIQLGLFKMKIQNISLTNVGNAIYRLRIERRLTQQELALAVGVDGAHISRIEAGTRDPSLDLFRKLMEALSVNVSFSLKETDDE